MLGIHFELVKSPTPITFTADAAGRLLRFSGARLARAEKNKNGDVITAAGIAELAASLAGNAVDIEHEDRAVCGIFTEGTAVEDPELGWVLEVGGLVHADRFPEIAAGMQDDTLSLSIEADGKTATCSICGQVFASSDMYCDHLQNKFKSGAARTVEGLTALGGGIVKRPAGNGTDFSKANIRFVASHKEPEPAPAVPTLEALMKNCPHCNHILTAAVDACPNCGKGLTVLAMSTDLQTALASLTALGTEKTTLAEQITALTADKTALTASVETLTADKAKAEKTAASQLETLRRNALGARITDEVWSQKKATILAMAEDAFATMLELAPAPAGGQKPAGVRLDADAEPEGADEKIKIVL